MSENPKIEITPELEAQLIGLPEECDTMTMFHNTSGLPEAITSVLEEAKVTDQLKAVLGSDWPVDLHGCMRQPIDVVRDLQQVLSL